MLFDAVRAELLRFSRHTQAWIWALLVIPVGTAIVGIFFRQFLHGQFQKANASLPPRVEQMATGPLDLGTLLVDQASQLAGINLLAFFLIGAAVIAASDYRWESWRLIRPRNSRPNLMLGKALAIAAIAIIPLLLFLLCELVAQIITASIEHRPILVGMDAKLFLTTLAMVMASWLRVIQVGLLALVAATVTRSLFGGFVIAIAFAAGTFLLERMFTGLGWKPEDWRILLLFPAAAYEAIQTFLAHGPVTSATATKAIIGLTGWMAGLTGLSIWLFQRQDLSKE